MRVHTGEMPFQCEVCHRRFRWVGALRSHMKLHERDGGDGGRGGSATGSGAGDGSQGGSRTASGTASGSGSASGSQSGGRAVRS